MPKWSEVTTERMLGYILESRELLHSLRRMHPDAHPFALGLLGASLVNTTCKVMDGDPEWWFDIIRDPNNVLKGRGE